MILIDTSAWVEYDRRTKSNVDLRLTHLIESGGPIAVTEPVVMEVLIGARTNTREDELRMMLESFPFLHFDQSVDFDGAARIYRTCRSRGITPRGLIDCLIANVAIRKEASLLAHDRDMTSIARVMDLKLDEASLTV